MNTIAVAGWCLASRMLGSADLRVRLAAMRGVYWAEAAASNRRQRMSTSRMARTPQTPYYAVDLHVDPDSRRSGVTPKRRPDGRAGVRAAGFSGVESSARLRGRRDHRELLGIDRGPASCEGTRRRSGGAAARQRDWSQHSGCVWPGRARVTAPPETFELSRGVGEPLPERLRT